MPKFRRRLINESLESRLCLTPIVFAERELSDSKARLDSLHVFDPDGDFDADLLYGDSGNELGWFENDGKGNFRQHPIQTSADLGPMDTGDLDGDGDVDVVFNDDDDLVWLENVDGRLVEKTRTRWSLRLATSLHLVDLDGDTDLDVIAATFRGFTVFVNQDGRGNFLGGSEHPHPFRGEIVAVEDINSDGAVDVIILEDHLAWYDGQDFSRSHVIIPRINSIDSAQVIDLDDDGDFDAIVAINTPGTRPDELVWYENTDARASFEKHTVLSGRLGHGSVRAVDVDGDLDLDLVATELFRPTVGFVVFENIGATVFESPQTLHGLPVLRRDTWSLEADFDGDGDLDFLQLNSSSNHVWYEQLPLIGDRNGDGIFDSSDLVLVFAAGRYEADSATFGQGDWNRDGRFDSSDLVLAFTLGHYHSAPEQVVATDVAGAIEAFRQSQDDDD